jgi:PAS domain S-box-containing protein
MKGGRKGSPEEGRHKATRAAAQTNHELRKRTHELGERIKELNCLYGISKLVDKPDASLDDLLRGAVELLPRAWEYPEVACARITLEGRSFPTANFRETVWRQASNVVVRGEHSGMVEVFYLEERPEGDEGPFLKEERELIDAVAERLGRIVERWRSEDALRESEAKYSALVEKAKDGVIIVQDEACKFANSAVSETTGYTQEELLTMPIWEVVVPEMRGEIARRHRSRIAGQKLPDFYEARIRCRDGTTLDVEASVAVIQYQGRPAVMAVVRDVSEQRRTQEALQRAYVQEATLRHQLEEEMKRRTDFLRALVHELKTPLTAVLASSNALVSHLQEGIALDFARSIERGASRLDRRISELTDLARGEIGVLHLQLESVDVGDLLLEIAEDMVPMASDNGQDLVLDMPAKLRAVAGDRERLRQVTANLLGNAFKFTPAGGRITLGAVEKDDHLVIYVQDTGPGVEKEHQGTLFDLYRRLPTGSSRAGGLGIGLALSKALVEAHDGQIWVTSEKGKGSTFGFSVPLATATDEKAGT